MNWATELEQTHQIATVICTHKDLVKIQLAHLGSIPLWAQTIGIRFLAGQDDFENSLRTVCKLIEE